MAKVSLFWMYVPMLYYSFEPIYDGRKDYSHTHISLRLHDLEIEFNQLYIIVSHLQLECNSETHASIHIVFQSVHLLRT